MLTAAIPQISAHTAPLVRRPRRQSCPRNFETSSPKRVVTMIPTVSKMDSVVPQADEKERKLKAIPRSNAMSIAGAP